MSHTTLIGPQAPGADSQDCASLPPARQVRLEAPSALVQQLDAGCAAFLDHARYVLNHSAVSVRTYRAVYGNFRHYLLDPEVTLNEAGRLANLDAWIAWNRKGRQISAITMNTYWRSLRPLFQYLERHAGVTNPFRGAKAPPIPRHLEPKALRAEQLTRLLDAARHYPWGSSLQRERAVALLGIMMFAGLRKGEVLRLGFTDVELAEGLIRVVRGKGRYGGKDRTVYMPPELRAILARYIAERRQRGFTCPEFFVSRANRGLSEAQLRRILRSIRTASGVPFFAHALRHSYITMLLRSRVPIHVVQSLAGHADMTTTARYVACFDEDKRAAAQRVRLLPRGHIG